MKLEIKIKINCIPVSCQPRLHGLWVTMRARVRLVMSYGFVWHVYSINNTPCKGKPPNSPRTRFPKIS